MPKILVISYSNLNSVLKEYGIFETLVKSLVIFDKFEKYVQEISELNQLLDKFNPKFHQRILTDEGRQIAAKAANIRDWSGPTKKGYTFHYFCRVVNTLCSKYICLLNEPCPPNMSSSCFRRNGDVYNIVKFADIDYEKMRNDGYQGYYLHPSLFKNLHKLAVDQEYIKGCIEWMETEQLVVWKWCFDQVRTL
jgi:hypothetical protein